MPLVEYRNCALFLSHDNSTSPFVFGAVEVLAFHIVAEQEYSDVRTGRACESCCLSSTVSDSTEVRLRRPGGCRNCVQKQWPYRHWLVSLGNKVWFVQSTTFYCSPDSVDGVATGVRLGHSLGLKFRQRQAIFSFSKMSRPALGHTHTTTIQCVSGFFTGVKWQGCDVYHSPPFCADVKNRWRCASVSCISLHGVDKNNIMMPFLQPLTERTRFGFIQ